MLPPTRVRAITRLFPYLWGLRLLPMGLFLFLAAANDARLIPPLSHLLALPLVFAATWWIHGVYRDRYGVVVPQSEGNPAAIRRFWWLSGGVAVAAVVEMVADPPVSLLGVATAAWMFASVFLIAPRPHRTFYAAAGALALTAFVVAALVGGVGFDEDVFEPGGFFQNLFLGASLTLGGLADHFLLARALSPLPRENHA